jgi:hypothetical protein
MKIFLISPSRLATPKIVEKVNQYVAKLEKEGHQVYWPLRDTNQQDPIGIEICDTNLRKILEADQIHVWYLKKSQGIHFDLGAAYLLVRILGHPKKIVFANKNKFSKKLKDLAEKKKKDYLRVLDFLDQDTREEGK